MTKKYTSHNIDEAVYLAMKGLTYSAAFTSSNSGRYIFPHTDELEAARKEFWTDGCKVYIHSWIALRQAMKHELKSQIRSMHVDTGIGMMASLTDPSLTAPIPFKPKAGDQYWVTVAGNPVCNIYGDKPGHQQRSSQNICYHTRDEALLAYKLLNK